MAFTKLSTSQELTRIVFQCTAVLVGYHSFEDFHQPTLATYSSIRRHDNIHLAIFFRGLVEGIRCKTDPFLRWLSRHGC